MAIEYVILSDLNLLVSRVYGRSTDEDLGEHFDILSTDPLFKPELDLLSDCRYITENLITRQGIKIETSRDPYLPTIRRVLLVQGALERARGRQYATYTSETEDKFLMTEDPDVAIKWLGHEAHADLIKQHLYNPEKK